MPSRRISQEGRAKFFSIYLRPWTLCDKLATSAVPVLLDLAREPQQEEAREHEKERTTHFRENWKVYLRHVLPHAEQCVRSFMLTCLAVGRADDAEDDKNLAKGPAVMCDLTLEGVHTAVTLSEKQCGVEKQMVANNETYVSKLVMATARRAVELTKLGKPLNASESGEQASVWSRHMRVPTIAKPKKKAHISRCIDSGTDFVFG